jgi:hypothetical protein
MMWFYGLCFQKYGFYFLRLLFSIIDTVDFFFLVAMSVMSPTIAFNRVVLVARGLLGAISTGMVESNLIPMGPAIVVIVGFV